MKPLLLCTVAAFAFACNTEREVQADLMTANLVKIDVVNRFPNQQQKMLTWRAANSVLYVTFEPMSTDVALGEMRQVMVTK